MGFSWERTGLLRIGQVSLQGASYRESRHVDIARYVNRAELTRTAIGAVFSVTDEDIAKRSEEREKNLDHAICDEEPSISTLLKLADQLLTLQLASGRHRGRRSRIGCRLAAGAAADANDVL